MHLAIPYRCLNRFRIFQRFFFCYLTLRARNIGNLIAYLPDQIDFAQAVLLFLFIEDRGEGVVGVFDVAAQVSDILLLFIGIAESDRAIRNGCMSGAVGVAFIVDSC
ncbi:TPA: hypothetical protein ACPZRZ_002651 [Yersinia enterocolitica]|nr:hypothetical protein [Yersinia enterocolitica]ELI7994306.1 hypothetical protein [Yersinia enterocolitica]ELW7359370.1 hypothetical protein [Yersinia enterocolitica]ELX2285271.1 hypothetical protein [Yersinia enterocolitica]EMA2900040.1 hypothetical protein [Yersinia enterocolitica]